jgi:2-dehydropantoate 2-reductase
MRIAVMGAGGTGGYFGSLLARAGEDLTLIARGTQLAAILANGLTVRSRLAGDFTIPIPISGDAREVGVVDLVLFCVKTYDAAPAAAQLAPLIGPETAVLPLLNGVEHVDLLAGAVGREHVLGGVAFVTANVSAPGVIVQSGGPGQVLLGELDGGRSARVERIAAALSKAGIATEIPPDIQLAMWEKFLFICGFSGLTALTRLPIGNVCAERPTCDLLAGVIAETADVARASGIPLPTEAVGHAMRIARDFEPWSSGSMAHDLAHGNRLELEALNGSVVRLGQQHGVPTPLSFAVYAALFPYVDGTPKLAQPPEV